MKVKDIPRVAVGAAAIAVRKTGTRLETIKEEHIDPFVEESADEGRKVIERIPGAARILGSAGGTSPPISDMPGIGDHEVTRLNRIGIRTVDDLWMNAGDRAGRREIAGRTGVSEDRLAVWAKRADLMKVRSIGPREAALLELAGVTSLKLLRRRRPDSLLSSLEEANRVHHVLDELPGREALAAWIEQADQIVA